MSEHETTNRITTETILDEIRREIQDGQAKFGSHNSAHEAYAVLKEEVDELWDSIKADDPDPDEAIQVAAVAARLARDLLTQKIFPDD